jgi:hypothetical protein
MKCPSAYSGFTQRGVCSSKSHQVVWRTEFCVIHSSHKFLAAQSLGPLWATQNPTIENEHI